MPFRTDHPQRRPGQSHDEHQAEMARWLGHSNVDEMNRHHDRGHVSLARWLGVTSHALREASGAHLNREEAMLAGLEEDALLSLTRYANHAGVLLP
jgi:hypothetical protein